MSKKLFTFLMIAGIALPAVAGASIGVPASVDTDIQVNTTMATTTVNTGATVNTTTGGNNAAIVENGTTSTTVTVGSKLEIDGDDIRALGTSTSIVTVTEVSTDENLGEYVRGLAQADASVRTVNASDNEVSIVYNRPARLFGFIPVTLSETASIMVATDGSLTVNVRQPWWSFLASSNLLSSELSSAIESRISEVVVPEGSTTLTAAIKAQLLSHIQTAASATYTQ